MKWSFQLGRIAGIKVYVHATFGILVVWLAARAFAQGSTPLDFFSEFGFIVLLFGCIVLHELGHALTARRFGIATQDITLLPIGGVARLERMPDRAGQELLVALAGPAVNLFLASAIAAILLVRGTQPVFPSGPFEGPMLDRLMWLNLVLLIFNLIPAFPMDGGRALRALLAMRISHLRATRIAASLGQALALGFGLLGLFGNPFLILIALFVWVGAAAEVAMVEVKSALEAVAVESAMLTSFEVVEAAMPLARVMELTLAGSQKDFPVLAGRELCGVLSQERLVGGLSRGGAQLVVGDVMEKPAPAVRPQDPLAPVLDRLQGGTARMLPVIEAGNLVGILTVDNVFELLRFQSALEAWRSSTTTEKEAKWRLATG